MDGRGVSDELLEVRITIQGRVQGVGYRWFALESARQLGVTGWASNDTDGSVVVEARGRAESIDAFVAALREGPAHARVTEVRTSPRSSPEAMPDHFTILR
jgi:acylphosphatase